MTDSQVKLNLKWVSDLVGDDYLKWKSRDIVLIDSPTGTGKNYFFINKILPLVSEHNKPILYVANRVALKREVKIDLMIAQSIEIPMKEVKKGEETVYEYDFGAIDKTVQVGNVFVESYQSIEKRLHANEYGECDKTIDFNDFSYCIFDEYHYQVDSSWTGMTDYSKRAITESTHNTIKIFTTATSESTSPIIQELGTRGFTPTGVKIYKQDSDYAYVDVNVFATDADLIRTINNESIQENRRDDKWLIFVTSKDKGKKLQACISDSIFISSDNKGELKSLIQTHTFESKVLIATSVIYNGINIKDDRIKNVAIYGYDKTTFIQELGRIRFSGVKGKEGVYANPLTLWIPRIHNGILNGYINAPNKLIDMADVLLKNPTLFEYKYGINVEKWLKMVYLKNNKPMVNMDYYYQQCDYIESIREAMSAVRSGQEDYCMYIRLQWLNWIGYPRKVSEVMDNVNEDSRYSFLMNNVGIHHGKKFRQDFIEAMGIKDTVNNNGLIKDISAINSYLKVIYDDKFSVITKKDTHRKNEDGGLNPNYQKTYISITLVNVLD